MNRSRQPWRRPRPRCWRWRPPPRPSRPASRQACCRPRGPSVRRPPRWKSELRVSCLGLPVQASKQALRPRFGSANRCSRICRLALAATPAMNLPRPSSFENSMTTSPRRLRKAVLPVAGLGTRVLPGTKTTPKELLNVVDRPILSYIVEEAREAGIEHIVFVTGRSKGAIEDYFDHQIELEAQLLAKGKTDILDAMIAELATAGEMSFTRQMQPLGLGHAVWCARDIIGDEPFAVLLPDMITLPGARGSRCLAQCVEAHEKHGGNVIAVEEVAPQDTHMYGIVSVGKEFGHTFEISGMVEKPPQGTA